MIYKIFQAWYQITATNVEIYALKTLNITNFNKEEKQFWDQVVWLNGYL